MVQISSFNEAFWRALECYYVIHNFTGRGRGRGRPEHGRTGLAAGGGPPRRRACSDGWSLGTRSQCFFELPQSLLHQGNVSNGSLLKIIEKQELGKGVDGFFVALKVIFFAIIQRGCFFDKSGDQPCGHAAAETARPFNLKTPGGAETSKTGRTEPGRFHARSGPS